MSAKTTASSGTADPNASRKADFVGMLGGEPRADVLAKRGQAGREILLATDRR